VCDSGPGLGQDDLLRLTQAGPVPAGGGVGLRLVHDLVVGMSGTIRHSHVEGLTDITITFPMRSNDA
ncbi:MAG: sensor histidine kinase, partial [Gemmobacter sp.]